jgi:4-cresol dehydrogenase (hydroxylating)
MAGIPDLQLMDKVSWYGGDTGGHLDFSVVAPMTGRDALRREAIFRPIVERHGFDYSPSIVAHGRSVVAVNAFYFDTADAERRDSVYAMHEQLLAAATREGYALYRAHLEFMDQAADAYSFNDHAYRRFNRKLKDALDPHGILAPGKQGIWPGGSASD